MRRRRNWRPEAGEKLVRAFEEWDKEFERRKKQELS